MLVERADGLDLTIKRMKIVLDTSVVRGLGYGEVAPDCFCDLSHAGHTIHLADGTIVELIAQVWTGRFAWANWVRARDLLLTFLDREEPVLLGGRDLFVAAGLSLDGMATDVTGVRRDTYDGWQLLSQVQSREALALDVSPGSCADPTLGMRPELAEQILSEEKTGWAQTFDEMLKLVGSPIDGNSAKLISVIGEALDNRVSCRPPPASVRLDAMIRVHALLLTRQLKRNEQYNPKKHSNDALDFDLLRYLSLPALLCVNDRRFLAVLRDSKTWQAKWVLSPRELAQALVEGTLPSLSWPVL